MFSLANVVQTQKLNYKMYLFIYLFIKLNLPRLFERLKYRHLFPLRLRKAIAPLYVLDSTIS